VQIEVHHVNPQVARAGDAHQGVEVGPVTVDQAAGIVDNFSDFFDVFLKKAEGVGIGQHQAGGSFIASGSESLQVYVTPLVAGNLLHAEAAHCTRGGVGAVRRIGDEHFLALRVAIGQMVGSHDQHAGKFAVGARGGLQANSGKSGDFLELLL